MGVVEFHDQLLRLEFGELLGLRNAHWLRSIRQRPRHLDNLRFRDHAVPVHRPDAAIRAGHLLGAAIAQSQAAAYRDRGLAVLAEFETRRDAREKAATTLLSKFFRDNPELQERERLVAAVVPWAAAEYSEPRDYLAETKRIVGSVRRGEGIEGQWFGVFTQTSTFPDGSSGSFSQFVRADFGQQGSSIDGTGMIGTGEELEFKGTLGPFGEIEIVVANTTSAINSRISGLVAADQMTLEFDGAGAGQRVSGTAVLFR